MYIPKLKVENLADESIVYSNPAIRIYYCSFHGEQKWLLERADTKQPFSIDFHIALLLLFCMRGRKIRDVISYISHRSSLDSDLIVAMLNDQLLLYEHDMSSSNEILETQLKWEQLGWGESFEHHLATYDYGFLPGNKLGSRLAEERMQRYVSNEKDDNRSKKVDYLARMPLPTPHRDLANVRYLGEPSRTNLDLDDLTKRIVALSCCYTGTLRVRWTEAPIYLRSVPSGGGRHPVEVYVIDISEPNEDYPVHHVDPINSVLGLISSAPNRKVHLAFSSLFERVQFKVKKIIVITTVFERNMYRYRDPRTFRSVHMDAGHMSSAIEILAEHFALSYHVEYPIAGSAIDMILGNNSLNEATQVCIAIG